jgi:hypothetical protein
MSLGPEPLPQLLVGQAAKKVCIPSMRQGIDKTITAREAQVALKQSLFVTSSNWKCVGSAARETYSLMTLDAGYNRGLHSSRWQVHVPSMTMHCIQFNKAAASSTKLACALPPARCASHSSS